MASRDSSAKLHYRHADGTRTLCGRPVSGNIGMRTTRDVEKLLADPRPCVHCKSSRYLDPQLGNRTEGGGVI